MLRTLTVTALLVLSACAVPTPFTVFSFAADGISYVATGKTVTDHALSAALGQDCALMRMVRGDAPCIATVAALASPVIYPGDLPANWTGSGVAEFAGFTPDTEFYALHLDDGALEIFAHDPRGGDGVLRLVATIDDFATDAEMPQVDIAGSTVSVADLMV